MFESFLSRFMGMNWAEITYILDEEEQLAREIALREFVAKRRELLSKGEYELEDGEIIE
uniref:Uncharacterized protein n=1 Tax=viral metagenome TaxID=1070528 RepID=A0A6C0HHC1_9ZZZZ